MKKKLKLKPIGASSDDYNEWIDSRKDLEHRFKPYPFFSKTSGYEIWRAAWLSCEQEHGIRKYDSRKN
jgi:hypothetical protein